LHNCTSCLANAFQVTFLDTASAENVSVGEVLCCEISDREFGKDNASSRGDNFVKLLVDDGPLSVDDLLEIIRVFKTNLCAVFLGLELKLKIERNDLRAIGERFGLLLKASV
jgi:hypothetical protein